MALAVSCAGIALGTHAAHVSREVGEELAHSISAGGTQTFSRDCDELQAIMVEDADLRIIGGLGPSSSTDVLRDGDFSCGAAITFTFWHSAIITDFAVVTTFADR